MKTAGLKQGIRISAAVPVLLAVLCVPSLAGARIIVKERAEVTDRTVLIGDVAEVQADTPEEVSRLETLKFSTAPSLDRESTYNQRQIEGRLYHAGVDLENVEIVAPDELTIHRKATTITGKRMVEEGIEFLRKNLPWESGAIEFEAKDYPNDVTLPFRETTLEYKLDTRPSRYGLPYFHVKIVQDGEVVRKVRLSNYVKIVADVVSAAREIESGQVIAEHDLEYVKSDLSELRPGTYNDMEDLVGKQAYRRVREGEIISRSMIETRPDINSGDMVTLVVTSPGLVVATQGKALEKGFIGENIRVLNVQSNQTLNGIVVDETTVEITGP